MKKPKSVKNPFFLNIFQVGKEARPAGGESQINQQISQRCPDLNRQMTNRRG